MERRQTAVLMGTAAVAGATFPLIEVCLHNWSPASVAFARVLLAALVLRIALVVRRRAGAVSPIPVCIAVAALQVAGPFWLLAAGQDRVSPALAAVLIATMPLFTVVAQRIVRAPHGGALEAISVTVGFGGVVLIVAGAGGGDTDMVGVIALLGSALGFALGGLVAQDRLAGSRLRDAADVMMWAAIILAPVGLAGLGAAAEFSAYLALLALGLVGTGLVFLALFELIARAGALRAALLDYLAPAFGVAYSVVLFDEPFTPVLLAGTALVAAGVVGVARTSAESARSAS